MTNPVVLFATATLIWGSTWIAITFQLGVVAPEVSVVYRFALASATVFVWCLLRRHSLRFPFRVHAWLAAQGATLYGLNYVAVYLAERIEKVGDLERSSSNVTNRPTWHTRPRHPKRAISQPARPSSTSSTTSAPASRS